MLLLTVVLLAAPAPALVKLPTATALVEAARRGDEVELERLARRLGAARLIRVGATNGDVAGRRAALRALGLLDEAWVVASQVLALLGDSDVGEAAARTARRLAERLGPELDDLLAEEVPPDVPRWTAGALLAAALHPDLPVPVRVETLHGALALSRLLPAAAWRSALDVLAGDVRPPLRRAALEARDPRLGSAAIAAALTDDDGQIAMTAGGLLCGGRLALSLDEPSRARVRALAVDEKQAIVARRRLVSCLRAFATPADRQLAALLTRKRR